MAEETPVSPITAAEPPKVPAAGAVSNNVSTLKLKPVIRKPGVGATQTGLKPGLKLPPKPGATATLKPGLNLPPKSGATATLKPGLKLPVKPVIRKPGTAAPSAISVPKPVVPAAPAATAAAPVESAAPVAKIDMSGVAKLPTVEMQAIKRDEEFKAPEAPKPMEVLKSVTQKLKGITQQIPAQAILHKTGIIGDAAVSDAQKQAAKSKTARISLSDAMGVAPVKNENAPMKTIRIKRPGDIPGATKPLEPMPAQAAEPGAEAAKAEQPAPAAASAIAPTVTQRKTLKISRPTGGAVRPGGKFGIKKTAAATAEAPAVPADAPASDVGEISDIADIPPLPMPPPPPAASEASDVPAWLSTICTIVQVAACVVVGALAWYLYNDSQLPPF